MACQTYPPTAFQVCGVIRDKYNQIGGPASFLLYPKSNELTNPGNTGKRSEFVGGNIYWSTATGAHPVAHDFLAKWGEKGYETGFLKYPATDEIVLSDNVSRRQEFQGGSIYWSPVTGAHSTQGAIRQRWIDLGADRSYLGFPTTDEIVTPNGGGRFNRFLNNAVIYWSAATGAHPVAGRILDVWSAAGYEKSPYGYPIEGAVPVPGEPGSYTQKFQFGSIYARSDDYFRGIIAPTEGGFASYDTNLHPGYKDTVDLSDYDTVADPTGAQKTSNYAAAQAVRVYFADQPQALAMWNHYYDNNGAQYQISSAALDSWMTEATTGYPGPVMPPATTATSNRDEAISEAIAEADRTGKAAKVVVGTPWVLTGGSSTDYVHSMGRHQMASTTAVIAQPGSPGNHHVDLRQQLHVYDIYDFATFGESTNPAKYGSEVGNQGMRLGIAKPYFSLGSGGVSSWSGMR